MTELEYCVLGVIWQLGPCTAYAVRGEFARSPSAHWSASAGTIYPVVERLVGRGFVESKSRGKARRPIRELNIKPTGLKALRRWIAQIDARSTRATYDSVRSRLLFLEALPDQERRRIVLDQAMLETRARLTELRDRQQHVGDMEALATLGAIYELEGRLGWLAEVTQYWGPGPRTSPQPKAK